MSRLWVVTWKQKAVGVLTLSKSLLSLHILMYVDLGYLLVLAVTCFRKLFQPIGLYIWTTVFQKKNEFTWLELVQKPVKIFGQLCKRQSLWGNPETQGWKLSGHAAYGWRFLRMLPVLTDDKIQKNLETVKYSSLSTSENDWGASLCANHFHRPDIIFSVLIWISAYQNTEYWGSYTKT